jgi:hypothetical protein
MTAALRIASMHLALALAAAVPAVAQTTWYIDVNATPPGLGTQAEPYTSIQYAVSQPTTLSGDTLLVAPGEYLENVATPQAAIHKDLVLRSTHGPLATTIRPTQPGWIVKLRGDSTLEGFTISGRTFDGISSGLLIDSGTCIVRRCIVRDNEGDGIGSFYEAYVTDCTVTGNGTGLHSFVFSGMLYAKNVILAHNVVDLDEDPSSFLGASGVIGAGDPGFWNYEERDLRLRPGSIAIDAGSTMGWPPTPLDPDGSAPDAGALTYDPTYAPGPEVYCTGKLNSEGCVASIGAIGSASASSAAAFTITASDELPNVPGLLFFGFAPRAAPFQGAWHCVEPPTPRVGGQVSAGSGPCGGTFTFDMNAYIQSGAYASLVPGEIVYCQWWSRDLQDPAGFGTGLTDALYFGIAP